MAGLQARGRPHPCRWRRHRENGATVLAQKATHSESGCRPSRARLDARNPAKAAPGIISGGSRLKSIEHTKTHARNPASSYIRRAVPYQSQPARARQSVGPCTDVQPRCRPSELRVSVQSSMKSFLRADSPARRTTRHHLLVPSGVGPDVTVVTAYRRSTFQRRRDLTQNLTRAATPAPKIRRQIVRTSEDRNERTQREVSSTTAKAHEKRVGSFSSLRRPDPNGPGCRHSNAIDITPEPSQTRTL